MTLLGDDALVGRVLNGRYRIGERIARGGMASVFMAQDERLDRTVAVKIMHHGLGDDGQFVQRFEREARAAAKLNHRNVVSVFDQGVDGEVMYLVMEYVPGHTLRDVIREESPMTPRRALDLLTQVLVALSAAHQAHIIHRDIKPENVLITPEGEVRVADFGLARAVSAATTATGGTLIGTVSYLAPEIVVNEGADARSDVYACGAMLYEMLTGAKPHQGETPIQVAYKHVHEDVPAPSAVVPSIPPYVDALVARATARDRNLRSTDSRVLLQQVRLVQRALEEGLADDPELTADLRPQSASRPPASPTSPDEDTAPVVIPPSIRVDLGDASPTEIVSTGATSTATVAATDADPEPTMQWSSGLNPTAAPIPARTGITPAMSPEQYRQAKVEEKSRRRGRLLFVGVIIAAVLLALFGWYMGIGRYDETPLLVGRSEAQARQDAEAAGFEFKVSQRDFSETAPLGTVIETDPGPGDRILPGDTIHATISKGQERYEIPAVGGKTVEEAEPIFAKVHLKIGDVTTAYSEKVPKNGIIRAKDYKVGDRVKRDTVVDLVVSKGKEPIDIPNQEGKKQADATKALEDLGFEVTVEGVFSDTVAKGLVVSQSPNTGIGYKKDVITLKVSKGPENIPVPNVINMKRDDAIRTLKAAGFKVNDLVEPINIFNVNYTVRKQNPNGGKLAKVGSTVTIDR